MFSKCGRAHHAYLIHRWPTYLAWLVTLLVLLPMAFLAMIGMSRQLTTIAHLWDTVLLEYTFNSLQLLLLTTLGTTVVGVASAWLTSHYQFFGRRILSWALVLPLAVPSYVVAYAYTDLLQFSGPVQTYLRAWLDVPRLPWFPDIRTTWGAGVIFTFAFYPYVYLLARTAFLEASPHLSEAARSMGYRPWRTFLTVILPLARPAIIVGVSLALMETLADYGAVSYFGVATFTTGIYKAWLLLGDQSAAAQLALVLMCVVGLLLWTEKRSRQKLRFYATKLYTKPTKPIATNHKTSILLFIVCSLPVIFGFILPVMSMLTLGLAMYDSVDWHRYGLWLSNSLVLGGVTALIALILALFMGYLSRLYRRPAITVANQFMGLGYALPGSVLAIGILLVVTGVDRFFESIGLNLLLSGSLLALVYAYVVRFMGVALQTVDSGLSKISPHLDESARSLGIGPWAGLRRIHFPLLRRSLLTGGLLVFVDVIKELPATLLLRPFNYDTLAIVTHQLASDERLGEAAFPALTIVLIGLIPIYLISKSNN